MGKEVLIVGAFVEIIELVEETGLCILGLIDNNKTTSYLGYPILGKDQDAERILQQKGTKPILISPDSPKIREKLHKYYKSFGFTFTGIISKNARVSKSTIIKEGSVVQTFVNVSSECIIGSFVKLNTYSNIMHNCTIGNYSTIAPNAVLLGNVSVGSKCYIGSNATILPNITISDDVVIGAGAVVTKNIFEKGVYVGCPAKKMEK